jgi:deazaflavin-dependent oxidoreductase (nitroreductase family)
MVGTFRASDGVIGGHFAGKTTLLLHTPGRKSGEEFVNPLVAAPYGDSYIVCGSAGGAPQHPRWVDNLEAVDGPVTIELGTVLARDNLRRQHRASPDSGDDLRLGELPRPNDKARRQKGSARCSAAT